MLTYQTPGVYYERADVGAPAISAVRTDVAGFVGIAARGPVDTPLPVQSWRQFKAYFGGCSGAGFLAYAVRAFFENGGRRCWVVRVASRDPNGGAMNSAVKIQCSAGQDRTLLWDCHRPVFARGFGGPTPDVFRRDRCRRLPSSSGVLNLATNIPGCHA